MLLWNIFFEIHGRPIIRNEVNVCLWRINYFRIAFTLNHSYKNVCDYMTTVCSIVHDRIQPQHHRKRQSTFILSVCLKAKYRIHAQDIISMGLKWPPLLCSKSLCFVLRYTGQPVFLVFQEIKGDQKCFNFIMHAV